eukprot:51596-Pyramimonas_sp.AAC.1
MPSVSRPMAVREDPPWIRSVRRRKGFVPQLECQLTVSFPCAGIGGPERAIAEAGWPIKFEDRRPLWARRNDEGDGARLMDHTPSSRERGGGGCHQRRTRWCLLASAASAKGAPSPISSPILVLHPSPLLLLAPPATASPPS